MLYIYRQSILRGTYGRIKSSDYRVKDSAQRRYILPASQPPRPGPHGIDYSKMGEHSPEKANQMRLEFQTRQIKEAIKIGMENQKKKRTCIEFASPHRIID